MYKMRVKNDGNIFEIPALLSSQRGNPESWDDLQINLLWVGFLEMWYFCRWGKILFIHKS